MKVNQNLNQIEQKLPRGFKKAIADSTGLSYNTVCSYFKNKKTSIVTHRKIEKATASIMEEFGITLNP